MSAETHPTELLAELLDGRLSGDERRSVDAHVRDCSTCQDALAALTAAKKALSQLPDPQLPADLEARVLRQINEADAQGPAHPSTAVTIKPSPEGPFVEAPIGWRSLLMAAAALLLVAGVYFLSRTTSDEPSAAAAHVAALQARQLTLESSTTDAQALQTLLQQRVPFPVRVFDLAMMGYTIGGGGAVDLAGHTAAAWVYRGQNGDLLCEMFVGGLEDLPRPEETREANGFTFYIYHRDGGTQVFWEEGDILCVLASKLPANEVIDLAIAKAMK